jgi:arylsulfatase A-like enzyme
MASSNDATSRSARPSVVVSIVGDSVGWGDISCYGGLAPTPPIDALAREGLRFEDYIRPGEGFTGYP